MQICICADIICIYDMYIYILTTPHLILVLLITILLIAISSSVLINCNEKPVVVFEITVPFLLILLDAFYCIFAGHLYQHLHTAIPPSQAFYSLLYSHDSWMILLSLSGTLLHI